VAALVEVGPGGVLAGLAGRGGAPGVVAVALLRSGQPEEAAVLAGLAGLFVYGVGVDWPAVFAPWHPQRVGLPTYAFQHRRYWPAPAAATADVAAAGLAAAGHPLLGAVLPSAESGGLVCTGRWSVATHPWLADHAVRGAVVFPGTGFVEVALRAGEAAGCGRLDELVVETPLVLPAHAGVQVQVVVGEGDDTARRPVAVYARPDGEESWTRHATGVLGAGPPPVGGGGAGGGAGGEGGEGGLFDRLARPWPPAGATPLDTTGVYDRLAGAGFAYGPLFQGLGGAWRLGGHVFAEVVLPEAARGRAGLFGIHPALLDAALHAVVFAGLDPADGGRVPFTFTGVALHACGAARVRVCLARTGPEEVAVAVADATGAPVCSIGALVLRPLPPGAVTPGAGDGDGVLLDVRWAEVAGPAAGPGPDPGGWALVGRPGAGGPPVSGVVYADVDGLAAAVGGGAAVPRVVVLAAAGEPARWWPPPMRWPGGCWGRCSGGWSWTGTGLPGRGWSWPPPARGGGGPG
jgi:acyl transferase domain-containing protein